MPQISAKTMVRKRDRVCKQCGKTDQENIAETGRRLHVHRTNPGAVYAADECELLCHACHRDEHSPIDTVIPRSPGERHTSSVGSYVTQSVRQRINAILVNRGMSLHQFVREACEEKLLREERCPK
jgi:hypothetical protein